VQLAAATRSELSGWELLEHFQRLPGPGEVRTLVGPPSPFAASTALAALVNAGFGDLLRGLGGLDALVDVGRIDATSPSLDLIRRLGAVVLVARPTLTSVLHTRELIASLAAIGVRCSLLLVGDRPYGPAEVLDAVGSVALLGVLPLDPIGARALCGDAKSPKVLGRTRLVRAADQIAARLASTPPTTADRSVSVPPEPAAAGRAPNSSGATSPLDDARRGR
jgi:hypothetical protein